MARRAIELGELGPRLLGSACALGEQFERCAGGDELPGQPGAIFEFPGVGPVARHGGVESGEFETQRRMPGGDQVVIDVHAGRADMACRAEVRAARNALRVLHAEAALLRRRLVAPRWSVVIAEPVTGGAVTAFAAHAVGAV